MSSINLASSPVNDFEPGAIDDFFSPDAASGFLTCPIDEIVTTGNVQRILDQVREKNTSTDAQDFEANTSEHLSSNEELAEEANRSTGSISANVNASENVDLIGKCRKLHIFVLSEAGKPIYSSFGDIYKLTPIMGVMQALVSFVAASKIVSEDQLRTIIANDKKFVFASRTHLILVAMGQLQDTEEYIRMCLEYVYQQLLSFLTLQRLEQLFSHRKSVDLAGMLSGDAWLITSMIEFVTFHSFGPLLNAFSCLPLNSALRDSVSSALSQTFKLPHLVFALLLANSHVVTLVRMKGQSLQPSDLHLIVNLVTKSQSLKVAQANWLPICLPKFDANGFLYANITYMEGGTCLVLLSVDNSQFYALQAIRHTVEKRLRSLDTGNCLMAIGSAQLPSVGELGISRLRHFVYKHIPSSQYVTCRWTGHYCCSSAETQALSPRADAVVTAYRRMHARLHAAGSASGGHGTAASVIFQDTPTEVYFATLTGTFEFYATFDPLTTKSDVVEIHKGLLSWIAVKRHSLFLSIIPVF